MRLCMSMHAENREKDGHYRMTTRVGINGFGRIGRLALRAAWGWLEITFAHIDELSVSAA